jgi:hypothetical protein
MPWQMVVADEIAQGAAFLAGNKKLAQLIGNYLETGTSAGAPLRSLSKLAPKSASPALPKVSSQFAKQEALKKMSEDLKLGMDDVATGVKDMSKGLSDGAKQISDAKAAENAAHKLPFAASPLLNNQILLKESIQDIVDAINSNTIASATFLAPISVNLNAISSTLIAISSTLLEISDNYAAQIESSSDLPYVDSDTFYDLLSKKGFDQALINGFRSDEKKLVHDLSANGVSYSEIKQTIVDYRKSVIPSDWLFSADSATAGITSPSPVDSKGKPIPLSNPDYSTLFERIASAKDSEKEHFEFLKSPVAPLNLHTENALVEVSPRQAKHAKDFELARGESDTNSLGGDIVSQLEDIYDGEEIGNFRLFSFMGVSSGFEHLNSESGDAEMLAKITAWMKL